MQSPINIELKMEHKAFSFFLYLSPFIDLIPHLDFFVGFRHKMNSSQAAFLSGSTFLPKKREHLYELCVD